MQHVYARPLPPPYVRVPYSNAATDTGSPLQVRSGADASQLREAATADTSPSVDYKDWRPMHMLPVLSEGFLARGGNTDHGIAQAAAASDTKLLPLVTELTIPRSDHPITGQVRSPRDRHPNRTPLPATSTCAIAGLL